MTAASDLPSQPAEFACSLWIGNAATRSVVASSTAMTPRLSLFDVPRLLQRQEFMAPVPADQQVASAVRDPSASLAAPKSP